jgi:hypothetical protein
VNRKEALVALISGHKVVSYFGHEFELTKHGLASGEAFVPMPEGNEYTYLGSPGNPHEVGTLAWARHEFEKGRRVRTPSGDVLLGYSNWDEKVFYARDFTELTWSVVETEEGECQETDCCQSEPCKKLCPELDNEESE